MRAILQIFCATLKNYKKTRQIRTIVNTAFSAKYLLYTNVGISISLSSVGDALEQQYELLTGQIDVGSGKRTAHMALSGATVGVVCHYWYQFLDNRIPGRSLRIVLKKVLLDQFICSPIVISTFFITMGILEQTSRQDMINEIREKAIQLYVAEWVVWPPAQIFNFYMLPHRYRVLYDNTISLGYDVYTSKVKHGKTHTHPANDSDNS